MSEDEMIQEINKTIAFMKEELKAKHSCFSVKELQAIETLLDLYKQEKEKNKKWEELYDEDQKYITQLNNKIFQLETDNKKMDKENQGLFEAYNFNDTNLIAKILKIYRKELKNSINKDKIEAKIEYYKNTDNAVGVRILENLLKEE